MSQLHHLLPPLAVGSLTAAGIFGKLFPERATGRFFPTVGCLAALCLGLAVAGAPVRSGLWLTDGLGLAVASAVALITVAILRFGVRHLDRRPKQLELMTEVSLVSGAVLLLLLSGHLALTWVAWVAAGLFIHAILTHDTSRPDAVFIARKKFLFGRISDALLAAAFVLMYRAHGSAQIADILAAPEKTPALAVALLAGAAVIRSALPPFHTWLPETMEAPAPVSALMHAGIVNAGGFLVIRFAPVMVTAPAVMHTLAVVGALAAVYGAVCMTAQPEAKRTLAYSTVAQMGFLMFTCGIGAFGAAAIHLIAHALYKADAFLSAGDAARAPARAAVRIPPARVLGALLLLGLPAALLAPVLAPGATDGLLLLITTVALAYGAARAASTPAGIGLLPAALAAGTAILAGTALLHGLGDSLAPAAKHTPPTALLLTLAAMPLLLLAFQTTLAGPRFGALKAALHAHALHGFYLNTRVSRWLAFLAPKSPARP